MDIRLYCPSLNTSKHNLTNEAFAKLQNRKMKKHLKEDEITEDKKLNYLRKQRNPILTKERLQQKLKEKENNKLMNSNK